MTTCEDLHAIVHNGLRSNWPEARVQLMLALGQLRSSLCVEDIVEVPSGTNPSDFSSVGWPDGMPDPLDAPVLHVLEGSNVWTAVHTGGTPEWKRQTFSSTGLPPTTHPMIRPGGRLTVESGEPAPDTDVSGSTLYYTPYTSSSVPVFDGGSWRALGFDELSIAVPSTTDTLYDVFVYDNAGTLTLHLEPWASGSARIHALTKQNGLHVYGVYLYLGTVRTSSVSGLIPDTKTQRFVWNAYNRENRYLLKKFEGTSYEFSNQTWTPIGGDLSNRVELVTGLPQVVECASNSYFENIGLSEVIGFTLSLDHETDPFTNGYAANTYQGPYKGSVKTDNVSQLSPGFHYLIPLISMNTPGAVTVYETSSSFQSGIYGLFSA